MKENNANENYKKWLKILRVVIPILVFPILFLFINELCSWFRDLNKIYKYLTFVCILFVLSCLIMLYKGLICSFWNFLKKDSIVHYIFLAVIPAMILFFGYQYVHTNITKTNFDRSSVNSNSTDNSDMTIKHENDITEKQQYDEIIDRLNGFYSALFTAIAIIAAILALGGWRTIKELREKLERFKEVEEKVDFLHEKKVLADWVQELFDKDNKKKIISSTELPISSPEDREKYKKIEEKILEEATDDGWLMIVYAKKLMESVDQKKTRIKHSIDKRQGKILSEIVETYESVKKIFEFIENKDMLETDSDVKTTLHNLQGKVHLELYRVKKLKDDWEINHDETGKFENREKKEYEIKTELENSINYYDKARNLADQKNESADETLGNLALVLIEKYKFYATKNQTELLNNAKTHLDGIFNKNFNTYWDKARAIYYLNLEEVDEEKIKKIFNEIEELLMETVKVINNRKDKAFFLEKLELELNETIQGKPGFPGNIVIINRVKDEFEKKNLY